MEGARQHDFPRDVQMRGGTDQARAHVAERDEGDIILDEEAEARHAVLQEVAALYKQLMRLCTPCRVQSVAHEARGPQLEQLGDEEDGLFVVFVVP